MISKTTYSGLNIPIFLHVFVRNKFAKVDAVDYNQYLLHVIMKHEYHNAICAAFQYQLFNKFCVCYFLDTELIRRFGRK